jgi:hypothetical protein
LVVVALHPKGFLENQLEIEVTVDKDYIAKLIEIGSSAKGLAHAQAIAKAAWPPFPHNGCAANLSALLQLAGINVPMTLGAGKLAHIIRQRGWSHIDVGDQEPGDIGVTFDEGGNPGADHIYLVIVAIDKDEMTIADNQDTVPHHRFASGKGRTPTEYFLRSA